MFYYKNYTCCLAVSRNGAPGNYTGFCVARTVPEGEKLFELAYPCTEYKNVVMSSDEAFIVCYGFEKAKNHLYVHNAKTGDLLHSIMIKYTNFKEVSAIVALPGKPSVVALIDVEKANLIDVVLKTRTKIIPCWDGICSKVINIHGDYDIK